jgi:hypothetical protein
MDRRGLKPTVNLTVIGPLDAFIVGGALYRDSQEICAGHLSALAGLLTMSSKSHRQQNLVAYRCYDACTNAEPTPGAERVTQRSAELRHGRLA